ncbi:MAG: hypothetical protein R3C11_00730 [Planctomycetaceae bacterium]
MIPSFYILRLKRELAACLVIAVLFSGCDDSSISYRDVCNPATLPKGVKFYEESREIPSKFPSEEHDFHHAQVLVVVETTDGEYYVPAINVMEANKSGFMGGVRKAYRCHYGRDFLSTDKNEVRGIDIPVSDEITAVYFHLYKVDGVGQKPDPDDWFVWQLPEEFEEPLIFPTHHSGELTEQMQKVHDFVLNLYRKQ